MVLLFCLTSCSHAHSYSMSMILLTVCSFRNCSWCSFRTNLHGSGAKRSNRKFSHHLRAICCRGMWSFWTVHYHHYRHLVRSSSDLDRPNRIYRRRCNHKYWSNFYLWTCKYPWSKRSLQMHDSKTVLPIDVNHEKTLDWLKSKNPNKSSQHPLQKLSTAKLMILK